MKQIKIIIKTIKSELNRKESYIHFSSPELKGIRPALPSLFTQNFKNISVCINFSSSELRGIRPALPLLFTQNLKETSVTLATLIVFC